MISEDQKLRMLYALSDNYIPGWDEVIGLDSQQRTLYALLQKCLLSKTNGMCLLVGPRGHGKRTLLKSCLRKLHQDHPKEKFRSIKISGLMMMNNSSDLSAVREIAAQLTVDYDVTNTYDNSNTFRPVIATDFYDDSALEYFDESDGSESWDEEIFNGKIDSTKNIDRVVDVFVSPRAKVPSSAKKRRLGNSRVSQGIDKKENLNEVLDRELPNNRHQKSFQSNLSVLTDAMKRAKVDRTPLLIILEDMEVFADRTSFRQVLLYHLLDKDRKSVV